MNKDINSFSNSLQSVVTNKFYSEIKIVELVKEYNLSINEVLAILNNNFVNIKDLRNQLSVLDLNTQKIIVISDTHIGSIFQNIEFINYVYDYASKENINHIIHVGDLIQSTIRPTNSKLRNELIQIEYLVNNYPKLDDVNTHIIFGNHDYHTLIKNDEYIKIIKTRKDFNILGFKRAYFTWNKYLLNLKHDIENYKINIPNVDTQLMLCGHRHEYITNGMDKIMVPCLCDDVKNYHTSLSLPGFLELIMDDLNIRIILHSFNPIDYNKREFENSANNVKYVYTRKLNNNFIIK